MAPLKNREMGTLANKTAEVTSAYVACQKRFGALLRAYDDLVRLYKTPGAMD